MSLRRGTKKLVTVTRASIVQRGHSYQRWRGILRRYVSLETSGDGAVLAEGHMSTGKAKGTRAWTRELAGNGRIAYLP